jgi:hypothetical protein
VGKQPTLKKGVERSGGGFAFASSFRIGIARQEEVVIILTQPSELPHLVIIANLPQDH